MRVRCCPSAYTGASRGVAAWRTYIRASLHLWNVSFSGYTRARVGYKQTQQISYLTFMRGWRPSWDGGCCWSFPRVLWAAADACKACHWSRKQRLLHNNTLAYCPVGPPSEARPVAQSEGSRFGLRNVKFLLLIQPMGKWEHLVISYWFSGENIFTNRSSGRLGVIWQSSKWGEDLTLTCYWWHIWYLWDFTVEGQKPEGLLCASIHVYRQ